MFNYSALTPVTNVNTRVSYDLRFSQKTGRFNMSQAVYTKYSIDVNGFNMLRQNNQLFLEVVQNDDATLHTGREGKKKGLSFTAQSMVNILGLTEDTEFTLEPVSGEFPSHVVAILKVVPKMVTERTEEEQVEPDASTDKPDSEEPLVNGGIEDDFELEDDIPADEPISHY